MIFGIAVLGAINSESVLDNTAGEKTFFSEIKIFGQNVRLKADDMRLRNVENLNIADMFSPLLFDNTTRLLAPFNNIFPSTPLSNIQAGKFQNRSIPTATANLFKKESNKLEYKYIKNYNGLTSEITGLYWNTGDPIFGGYVFNTNEKDYLIKNRTSYDYLLIPYDINFSVISYYKATTTLDSFAWFLGDEENTFSYKFDMNVQSTGISIQNDFNIYENYSNIALTKTGNRKYRQSTLSTIPYSIIIGEEFIDVDFVGVIKEFILNGKPKILRNPSGEILKVMTHGFNYKYSDNLWGTQKNNKREQPITISFDYVEIGEI